MPCEHYRDALIEVAASGVAPQSELRAHLAACASCRAAYAEDQMLFASIDSALHVAVNTEVPTALLPRVRAQLDDVVVPRFRWLRPLVLATAGVALAFAVFLMARPHHARPEELAKGAIATPTRSAPTETNSGKTSSEGTQIAAVRVPHSYGAWSSTTPHSVASGNPEVLVPPDEREAFGRLIAVLNERADVSGSLLAKVREEKDGLETVDPLKIPEIEIKPLEGTETETSDGTGEKH